MPRRRIEQPVTETETYIDLASGRPAGKAAVPAVCGRIRRYREKAGLEQKALAGMIGVTANAVSNWENGRGRPDLNLLPALCSALGVSMNTLFGIEETGQDYSAAELDLIARCRELTPGHRTAVGQLVDTLLRVQEAENIPPLRKLLFYEKSLSAGPGDPTEFEAEGEPLWIYASRETDRADCVFTVNGDSMEPGYHSGDMVLVSRIPDAPDLRHGEVGAFICGNETYIKVFEEDGLHSLNPDYAVMRFTDTDSVYLIGRVTGILDPAQAASDADIEKYLLLHPEEA